MSHMLQGNILGIRLFDYKIWAVEKIFQTMGSFYFHFNGMNAWRSNSNGLSFCPMFYQTLRLHAYPNCTFLTNFLFCLQADHTKVNFYIKIFGMKMNGKEIKLENYPEMLRQFQKCINRIKGGRWLVYNVQINQLEVQFYDIFIENIWRGQFFMNLWRDVKIQIIEKFFSNVQFHDELTEQNMTRLKIYHSIHKLDKQFREDNRKSERKKKRRSFSENKTSNQYQMDVTYKEKLVKNTIEPLFLARIYKPSKYIISQLNEETEKIRIFSQRLKQKQLDPKHTKNQIFQSLYEEALIQLNKEDNEQQLSIEQRCLQKYQTHTICQGIIIKQDFSREEPSQATKQQRTKTTNMSHIQIIECEFKYVISIHNNKDLLDHHTENTNQQIQNENLHSSDKEDDASTSQFEKKFLVKKTCLNNPNGLMSFANEIDFIKSIRDRVFPYFGQYLLETVNVKEKQNGGQMQTITQIVGKPLYMEYYDRSLAGFIQLGLKLFRTLSIQMVLKMLIQIASTLKYLQNLKVLHRDFKHQNIMIDKRGNVRFIDWGSCCFRYQSTKPQKIAPKQLKFRQRTTKLLTTQGWSQRAIDFKNAHPELFERQFNNDHQQFNKNPYFDIYSFGVLVNIMLSELETKYKAAQNQEHWLLNELKYFKSRLMETNPFDRLKPLDMLLYINELMKIQKEKKKVVNKIERNLYGWIVNYD